MLQDGAEPFIGDYQAWLDAAQSIEGPTSVRYERGSTVRGDMYVIQVPLDQARDLLDNRFQGLTSGANALVDRGTLIDSLAENGMVQWSVVLDPATGRLLAQSIQFDLNSEIDSSAVTPPYESLKLAYSTQQNVRFSAVNEPIPSEDLPTPQ
jgi:hypothetical protein